MKIKLSCEFAKHDSQMKIRCLKSNSYCGNQYFKQCKGWWALTDRAAACPLRKERKE